MKNLMKNFRELSYFELLETNGGYGGSSGGGGKGGSSKGYSGSSGGSSGKSGKKSGYNALTSGLSAPHFVTAREKGRMAAQGRVCYSTPTSGVPTSPSAYSGTSSGQGGDPYGTDYENKQRIAEIEKFAYKKQKSWDAKKFGNEFGGEACCATSILNEVSEIYTKETGKTMTAEQQDAAMTAAIGAGMINNGKGSKESAAYVNDKLGAATVMAESLGLSGSFSYREGGDYGDGTVYKLTKTKDEGKTTYTHFVNSAGEGRYYDPSTGKISYISDFAINERIVGVTTFTLDYHR